MNRFGSNLQENIPQPMTLAMQQEFLQLYPSTNMDPFQSMNTLKYIPVSLYTGNSNLSDDEDCDEEPDLDTIIQQNNFLRSLINQIQADLDLISYSMQKGQSEQPAEPARDDIHPGGIRRTANGIKKLSKPRKSKKICVKVSKKLTHKKKMIAKRLRFSRRIYQSLIKK